MERTTMAADDNALVIDAKGSHKMPTTKRERVLKALAAERARSDRSIAKEAGCDRKYVGRVREELGAEFQVAKRIGVDGKERRVPTSRPALAEAATAVRPRGGQFG
jgi:hypothetical protein